MKKVKITNTTVKKPKIINGKDVRTALERVGHGVQFTDGANRRIRLNPTKSIITEPTDPGLIKLSQAGYIKIEQGADIADQFKNLSLNPSKVSAPKSVEVKKEVVEEVVEQVVEEPTRMAHAVEMGKDEHSGSDFLNDDDAVDPDGKPNFVVQAPSAETRSKKKRKKRNNEMAGEADIL